MKKISLIFVLLITGFVSLELKAQNLEIDSLENLLLKHTKKDTIRINLLNETAKVFAVPGANMVVIVRHGHYLSLYSNIVNVRVKQGDIVNEGHYIGDLYIGS